MFYTFAFEIVFLMVINIPTQHSNSTELVFNG